MCSVHHAWTIAQIHTLTQMMKRGCVTPAIWHVIVATGHQVGSVSFAIMQEDLEGGQVIKENAI